MNNKFLSRFFSAPLAMLLLVSSIAGCASEGSEGSPLLPAGFEANKIPDVSLNGYIYANQDSPIVIPADFMQLQVPQLAINSLQVWLGPDVSYIGGTGEFASQTEAAKVPTLVESLGLNTWCVYSGKNVYVVSEDSPVWAASLKTAITQNKMVVASAINPETTADFSNFPSKPPTKPVVAGFLDASGSLLDSLGSLLGIPLSDFNSALGSAKISRLALVAYSSQPLSSVLDEFVGSNAEILSLSLLGIGKSSYPAIVLSMFFDKTMTDAGYNKYTAGGVTLYELSLDGTVILVTRQGNLIYGAMAQYKADAEKLLLSCFD